jgi:hypothetical protein
VRRWREGDDWAQARFCAQSPVALCARSGSRAAAAACRPRASPASVLSGPTSNRPLARSTSRQTIAPVAEARPPPRSRVDVHVDRARRQWSCGAAVAPVCRTRSTRWGAAISSRRSPTVSKPTPTTTSTRSTSASRIARAMTLHQTPEHFVEALTDRMEESGYRYFAKIDKLGGMVEGGQARAPASPCPRARLWKRCSRMGRLPRAAGLLALALYRVSTAQALTPGAP